MSILDHKFLDVTCDDQGCQALILQNKVDIAECRAKRALELAKRFQGKVHIFQLTEEELKDFNLASKELNQLLGIRSLSREEQNTK